MKKFLFRRRKKVPKKKRPPFGKAAVGFFCAHWQLLIPLAGFLAVTIPYVHYLSVWDGRIYWNCLQSAVSRTFEMNTFLCAGHPTLLFMLLFAGPQYLLHSHTLLNITSIVLGCIGVVAVYACGMKLFPKNRTAATFCALLFAWNPVFIANVVNFNPDTGIAVFLSLMLCGLLWENLWIAAIGGLLMCFTKEIGFVLYLPAMLLYLVLFVTRAQVSLKQKCMKLLRSWPLLVPVILYAAFMIRGFPALGIGVRPDGNVWMQFLTVNLLEHRFVIVLADIFVLHFAWISTLVIVLAAGIAAVRWMFGARVTGPGLELRGAALIVIFLVAETFIFTRFMTFNNPRYYLALYVLNSLAFCIATQSLPVHRFVKIGVLSLVSALTILSVFRSIDPVSKRVFSTFPFGSHSLYNLSGTAGDGCCGLGRDQLIYNLEYTHLSTLQEMAMRVIKPKPESVIVQNGQAAEGFSDTLDPVTFRRSIASNAFMPRYLSAEAALKMNPLPETLYFLAFPNFVNDADLKALQAQYPKSKEWTVGYDGHTLTVTEFTK